MQPYYQDDHTHPCPTPKARRRKSGSLWVCTCGQTYVCRLVHYWDSCGWEWVPCDLNPPEASS